MKNKTTLVDKKAKSGVEKLSTRSKYAIKIRAGRTANSPFNGGGKVLGEKFVSGFHFFTPIDEDTQ